MLYKAIVGNAFVKSVLQCFDEIQLTDKESKWKYIDERDKEYLLKVFPDAEIKEYEIVEKD